MKTLEEESPSQDTPKPSTRKIAAPNLQPLFTPKRFNGEPPRNGRTDVEAFIKSFGTYVLIIDGQLPSEKETKEQVILGIFGSMLDGKAEDWWLDLEDGRVSNLKEAYKEIRARFPFQREKGALMAKAIADLNELKQGDKDVDTYVNIGMDILGAMGSSVEQLLIERFIEGIANPIVRLQMAATKATTTQFPACASMFRTVARSVHSGDREYLARALLSTQESVSQAKQPQAVGIYTDPAAEARIIATLLQKLNLATTDNSQPIRAPGTQVVVSTTPPHPGVQDTGPGLHATTAVNAGTSPTSVATQPSPLTNRETYGKKVSVGERELERRTKPLPPWVLQCMVTKGKKLCATRINKRALKMPVSDASWEDTTTPLHQDPSNRLLKNTYL